jgi:hypothetical protein
MGDKEICLSPRTFCSSFLASPRKIALFPGFQQVLHDGYARLALQLRSLQ